jgi:uncharacterized protein YggE
MAVSPMCLRAQEAGNRAYGNQGQNLQQGGDVNRRYPTYYGKAPDEQITHENPNLLVTTYQFIEAKLLTSVPTKEYVAVFGLMQEAPKLDDANRRLQAQISGFQQGLTGLGISPENVYLDFITQNRTYDYQVKNNTARERVSGFQIKENLAIRFKDHKLLDKIVPLAAQNGIYDLVKVDYVTEDLAATRARMLEEALKIIEKKKEVFNKLGVKLTPVTVVADNFDTFQPFEAYNSYRAYETGNVDDNYRVVEQRKSSTLYFEPLRAGKFDAVLTPIGLEPQVQCTYYLRVKYFVNSYTTVQPKTEDKKP